MSKNPGNKVTHKDKIEKQLENARTMAQPKLWFTLAKSAFNATGKNNAAIHVYEAKPMTDKTFKKVCIFIVNKFFKHKHIMQATVTPSDTIVKAFQDLTVALHCQQHTKGSAHFDALMKTPVLFEPHYNLPAITQGTLTY